MSTQPIDVRQVGYPDFWPIVLEKYKKFFLVTQGLGPTIDDLFSVAHTEPFHKVARHLAKMVTNSVRSRTPVGDERVRYRRNQGCTHDVRIGCHSGVPQKAPG